MEGENSPVLNESTIAKAASDGSVVLPTTQFLAGQMAEGRCLSGYLDVVYDVTNTPVTKKR